MLGDDALKATVVSIPRRPGPKPVGPDAEILTVALVRHSLGRPREARFLEEVRQNWSHYFPTLPGQSEFNRRGRWLGGAFAERRADRVNTLPEDTWQPVATPALPVKPPSRGRGPDRWPGPGGLVAGLGWDAAHREWFYGFRLALRTDLGQRLGRRGGTVPAAGDERQVADDRLEGARGRPKALRLDRGFRGHRWGQELAEAGITGVFMPGRQERRSLSRNGLRPSARFRNRVETTMGELTEQRGRARHGARTFWGLLTRTAAAILAHTLRLLKLV